MSVSDRTINIAPETMTVGFYADATELGRSMWPSGEWDAEDFDWGVWTDAETGFQCSIRRNHSGSWCGYVLIDQEHPLNASRPDSDTYGGDLTAGNPVWLEVHGGVTFHGIWSLSEANLSGWAVGFDCNHAFDENPRYSRDGRFPSNGEYRTFPYVIEEVRRLAKQISEYEPLKQLVSGPETQQEV